MTKRLNQLADCGLVIRQTKLGNRRQEYELSPAGKELQPIILVLGEWGMKWALDAAGIVRSMSRAGNCYDNATMEAFWRNFKTETEMDIKPPATRAFARLAIFDHIETFYNPKRRHSSLGYRSPVAFELKYSKNEQKRCLSHCPLFRGKP